MFVTLHPIFDRWPGQHLLLCRQAIRIVCGTVKVLQPTTSATKCHAKVLLRGIYSPNIHFNGIGNFFWFLWLKLKSYLPYCSLNNSVMEVIKLFCGKIEVIISDPNMEEQDWLHLLSYYCRKCYALFHIRILRIYNKNIGNIIKK